MKQATKRFVSILGSMMLVVGAFVTYFYFIQPIYEEAQVLKAEIFARQNFIDRQRSAIEQVSALIKTYQGERGLQDVISMALPLEPDRAGALAQIYGIPTNERLDVSSVSFAVSGARRSLDGTSPVGAGLIKPLGNLRVTVQFRGAYEDFKRFLEIIETNIRIFNVESVSISPAAEADAEGETVNVNSFTFSVNLMTYFQNV